MHTEEVGAGPRIVREIDMTPLIDVSLVLVVMLLLTTPLAFESSFAVKSAQTTARSASVTEPGERLELHVLSEVQLRVNRDVVSREQLSEALRPLLAGEAPPLVVVSCEDDVSHGAFVHALDTAKVCGATEIAVMEK